MELKMELKMKMKNYHSREVRRITASVAKIHILRRENGGQV
jgi:hypothetical protein